MLPVLGVEVDDNDNARAFFGSDALTSCIKGAVKDDVLVNISGLGTSMNGTLL
jgi:hypothetical protein